MKKLNHLLTISLWAANSYIFRKMLVKLWYKKRGFLILCYYLFTHAPPLPSFLRRVNALFFGFFIHSCQSHGFSSPWTALDGSLEEEKAVEKQNTQTQTRLGMGCNERWRATESNIRLPLAKLLSTSLNLKMSFKVSRAIHAKASY